MIVIGLTGGIASGKSTVAAMLQNAKIPVIDADDLAKRVTEKGSPVLSDIVALFGRDILANDQTLDRKKLAKIVFDDGNLLRKLEAIVHPAVEHLRRLLLTELEHSGHKVAVYMAPLIFEKDLHKDKDLAKTLLITADQDLIKRRIANRDGLSMVEAQKRIDAQLDDETKITMADEVIENNGTMDELYKNLALAWQRLTGMKLTSPYHD